MHVYSHLIEKEEAISKIIEEVLTHLYEIISTRIEQYASYNVYQELTIP